MLTFTQKRRVNFAETDAAGIMHFANYFRWMEEIEHEMFRSLGLSVVMELDGVEISWPRVSTSCEYQGPLKFEEVVDLTLRVTRVGEKSLSYEVEFTRAGQRIAIGKLTSVCVAVEQGSFRTIAIPDCIRQKLHV